MKDKQLLLAVLALLEREKTVSIPQLATLLDVPEEEVHDAIETLVFAYDAASIRLDLHDAYATLNTYGTDRLLRLTAPEADALVDALDKAGISADTDLVCSLLHAKSVLQDAQSAPESRLQVISESGQPEVIQTVAAACEDAEHHLLRIEYQGIDDPLPQTRLVEPHVVFSEGGHRYLQGYCREACAWRSFRLDRILAATPTEQTFTPRDDAPDAMVGIARGSQKARIVLDPGCPLPSWHSARIVKTNEDGSRVVSVSWTGSMWLPRHVVALAGRARVLAPDALKSACASYAKELLSQ